MAGILTLFAVNEGETNRKVKVSYKIRVSPGTHYLALSRRTVDSDRVPALKYRP